jgi:hypothetical protein
MEHGKGYSVPRRRVEQRSEEANASAQDNPRKEGVLQAGSITVTN